jgi:hypothetical protein
MAKFNVFGVGNALVDIVVRVEDSFLKDNKIRKGVIFMCSAANEYQEFILEGAEWAEYEKRMWARLEQYYLQIHK